MKRFLLTFAALAASATAAHAATVTFNFGSKTGDLGTSETYTDSTGGTGLTVTAMSFNPWGSKPDLYGKNAGGDEIGLGLTNDPSGDHEIYYHKGFVQLDISNLLGKVSNPTFSMDSTTSGEKWSLYGSNTSGVLGTLLESGSNENVSNALLNFGTYKYYDFVAKGSGDNVLLHNLAATAPEPAAWGLMLVGFGAIGAALRSRKEQLARLA